ncbi:uncharacterized protein MKZ38_003882 [Zalerion maritima]|uniref:Zn(2)-C6 fungal-type domain-containing protein n=1 Tax=Zalerion maritima TaxID=339359 RepID=A0AAD5S4I5_9PEZI|nr:uncharacterized protein MKZ38_003882 [Zalerion maritima]
MHARPQSSHHDDHDQKAGATSQPKPLSCISCRQRKVKCDRIHPCSQCLRSSLACVFPARKRAQRQRQNRNGELLQRLNRLESIVAKVDPGALEDNAQGVTGHGHEKQPRKSEPGPEQTQEPSEKQDPASSKASLPLGLPNDRYVSAEFWSILSREVDGIRTTLEQDTGSSTDEENVVSSPAAAAHYTSPESSGGSTGLPDLEKTVASGSLFGNTSNASQDGLVHPSPGMMGRLCERYFESVDRVLKILHRPTCMEWIEAFVKGGSLDPPHEALLFALYFGAVTSWTPEECSAVLGEDRSALVSRCRARIETALAMADYLNSESMECLQALAIYVVSLAIRLAQGMNLHRDSDGSQFTPFQAELRRRLWWQLIVLDMRAAEDRGTEVIVTKGSHNTQMPTNINDADFGPETTKPLVPRKGPTDITFSLATAKCSDIFSFLGHPQSQTTHFSFGNYISVSSTTSTIGGVRETEDNIIRYAQHLEDEFVNSADENFAPSYIASKTVRMCILKMWLSMQYPFHLSLSSSMPVGPQSQGGQQKQTPQNVQLSAQAQGGGVGSDPTPQLGAAVPKPTPIPHDFILRTTTAILELTNPAQYGPWASSYVWWSGTWAQWHPLAVCLATLCTVPIGDLADRAWKAVDEALPSIREQVADSHRGKLWRPMRKLLRRARTARAEMQMKSLGLNDAGESRSKKQRAGDSTGKEGTKLTETVSSPGQTSHGMQATVSVAAASSSNDKIEGDVMSVAAPDLFDFNVIDISFHPSNILQDSSELFQGVPDAMAMDYSNDWEIWNEFVNDTRSVEQQPAGYPDFGGQTL